MTQNVENIFKLFISVVNDRRKEIGGNSYTELLTQKFLHRNSHTVILTQKFSHRNSYTEILTQKFNYCGDYTLHSNIFVPVFIYLQCK